MVHHGFHRETSACFSTGLFVENTDRQDHRARFVNSLYAPALGVPESSLRFQWYCELELFSAMNFHGGLRIRT